MMTAPVRKRFLCFVSNGNSPQTPGTCSIYQQSKAFRFDRSKQYTKIELEIFIIFLNDLVFMRFSIYVFAAIELELNE